MEPRLMQPASRDQIVAIIRQRAERAANREMFGVPGAAAVRPVGPAIRDFEQAYHQGVQVCKNIFLIRGRADTVVFGTSLNA